MVAASLNYYHGYDDRDYNLPGQSGSQKEQAAEMSSFTNKYAFINQKLIILIGLLSLSLSMPAHLASSSL